MSVPLARLDSAGWVTSAPEKAAALFEYYCRSEYSQSNMFRGTVKSLPYTLSLGIQNFVSLQNRIQTELTDMYTPWFDSTEIRVSVDSHKAIDDPDQVEYGINISGVVGEKGRQYQLNRILTIRDKTIVAVREVV